MLQYSLVENPLSADADAFIALPANVRTFDLGEITQRILARHPGMGLSQINAVIEEFFGEVCIIVEDGGAVNTPLFNAQPSIAGVFDGAADSYEPARHRVKANLTPGVRMKAAAAGIRTQKVQMPDPLPFIVEVSDVLSGTVNEHLTPGGVVQLKGGRLKLFTANPDNGIFLTHEDGQGGKLEVIVENKPSRLIAMLPAAMPKGTYTVEVRTTYSSSGKESKTMKTGHFTRELTVV